MAADAEQMEEGAEGVEPPKSGGKGWILILVALLVLGGGGFAAWKMLGSGGDAKPKQEVKLPPRYINLDPPFVVNFESDSMVRFLQVTVGIMTRDTTMETLVKDNDPRVRNDLLMILGNQSYESVATLEGKESLRQKCLETIRSIVAEMNGDPQKIEALYFTSFVMQ